MGWRPDGQGGGHQRCAVVIRQPTYLQAPVGLCRRLQLPLQPLDLGIPHAVSAMALLRVRDILGSAIETRAGPCDAPRARPRPQLGQHGGSNFGSKPARL